MSQTENNKRVMKVIDPSIKALKAARILNGFSRKEAGDRCGFSARAIEQLENGRSNPSEERIAKILRAYGLSQKEFQSLKEKPDEALARAKISQTKAKTIKRKPRRSCFRIITKEVRVIRVLRNRKGISQDEASLRCGYTRAIFGQIENGRINIPPKRIEHIVQRLGFSMQDFHALMKAEILRDEAIAECVALLHSLDDQNLASARTVIKSLGGL